MPSALSTRSLARRLTMPITAAPRARSRSTVRLVSVVVPLWLTAMTSVSLMSSRSWKPDSSVAGSASMSSWPSLSSSSSAAALWPATAAVPWPMTRMRLIEPSASRAATAGGRARSPTSARSTPAVSAILPRRVFWKERGASLISFSRKCGASPRSMSRVVTVAVTISLVSTGLSDPSYRRRRMPARSPARFASSTTISPPCSPSSRRYSVVSSTTPYGSLATMKQSSARPMYRPCPLPESASSMESGACELIAPIATEPSNADTVRRNDSTRSQPAIACRLTSAGITLASVVMCWWMRSWWATRRSAWLSTSPLSVATTYGHGPAAGELSSSSLFTGCAFGSEMMPTLAHRVWPSTAVRAPGEATATRSRSSPEIAARSARVLSPSSPISAAALYTNDSTPSVNRSEPDW